MPLAIRRASSRSLALSTSQHRAEDLLLRDASTWRDLGHDQGTDVEADVRQFADIGIENDPSFLLCELCGIRGSAAGHRRR